MHHFDDCAGIGGFSLACKWAGIETKWAREIEDYPRQVYTLRFPYVELFKDVKEPLPKRLKGQVDLYTCGFPCQPVSVAGKRKGQSDSRWLWPWIARTIGFLRPRYVLLENVPGLRNRGMEDVLRDLASCGYDAEWDCLPASAFGAPHRRDRVWLIAYPAGYRYQPIFSKQTGQHPEVGGVQDTWFNGKERNVADPESERWRRWPLPIIIGDVSKDKQGGKESRSEAKQYLRAWSTEPDVGRVADGVPSRVDRLKCLGNAIVPQVAYWIMKRLL